MELVILLRVLAHGATIEIIFGHIFWLPECVNNLESFYSMMTRRRDWFIFWSPTLYMCVM